jgi:hypothetical protein
LFEVDKCLFSITVRITLPNFLKCGAILDERPSLPRVNDTVIFVLFDGENQALIFSDDRCMKLVAVCPMDTETLPSVE